MNEVRIEDEPLLELQENVSIQIKGSRNLGINEEIFLKKKVACSKIILENE
jgi:hypothetical protein